MLCTCDVNNKTRLVLLERELLTQQKCCHYSQAKLLCLVMLAANTAAAAAVRPHLMRVTASTAVYHYTSVLLYKQYTHVYHDLSKYCA
jgi:hypothetical protein